MCPLVDLTSQIEEPTRCGGGAYGDIYKCKLSDSSSIVNCFAVPSVHAVNSPQVAVKAVRCFENDQEIAERLQKVGVRELRPCYPTD